MSIQLRVRAARVLLGGVLLATGLVASSCIAAEESAPVAESQTEATLGALANPRPITAAEIAELTAHASYQSTVEILGEGGSSIQLRKQMAMFINNWPIHIIMYSTQQKLLLGMQKQQKLRKMPKPILDYAQMLKANGKYDDANKRMAKFASLAPNDSRAKDFKANPNYIPKLLSKKAGFTVTTNPVSSENSDFGAVLYDDALYFSSARAGSKNYGWDNQPYLDIYRSILGDNGNFSESTPVSTLNTKFHDGTISITSDGNAAYYSTESFKDNVFLKIKSNNTKAGRIFIYKATKVGDTWANSTMLPFNSKEY